MIPPTEGLLQYSIVCYYHGMPIQKKTDFQMLAVLFFSFLLLLGLGTAVVVTNNSSSQDSRSQASFNQPFLTLSPSFVESEKSGETFTTSLTLNSQDQIVGGISGEIVYDPEILELKTVHKGAAFNDLVVNTPSGTISLESNDQVAGEAEIITLVFQVIASTFPDSYIRLNSDFAVLDPSGSLNVLSNLPDPVTVRED